MNIFTNTRDIVNYKVQTMLFAFSICMHVAAASVAVSHPLLGWLLAMLETVGWICILTIWAIALIRCIQYGGAKLWARVRTYQVHRKKAKNNNLVPIEQLKHLRNTIDRLGLALHGLTPEMEQARQAHFQMGGEAVPPPVLPPQNAVLYAEFLSLVKVLNHLGFPHLERVRLEPKDLAFIQQWRSDLETRLQQAQRAFSFKQQVLEYMLGEACKTLEHIGSQYPQTQDDAGYQRIQGALRLLKKMARQSHCPEEVTSSIAALLQDMESLDKQLKQAAA
jgi:hypothetical protein